MGHENASNSLIDNFPASPVLAHTNVSTLCCVLQSGANIAWENVTLNINTRFN